MTASFPGMDPWPKALGEPITSLWRLQMDGEPRVCAARVRMQPAVWHQPRVRAPARNPV